MNTVVSLTKVPSKSIILDGFGKPDYLDSYKMVKPTQATVDKIATEIFRMSKSVEFLMKARDSVVRVFGLKTSGKPNEADYYPVGSRLMDFTVSARNENEIVMEENDKHLRFRTSVLVDRGKSEIYLTTIVKFNNMGGRIYFIPVKPFHKIIVKSQFKDKVSKLK